MRCYFTTQCCTIYTVLAKIDAESNSNILPLWIQKQSIVKPCEKPIWTYIKTLILFRIYLEIVSIAIYNRKLWIPKLDHHPITLRQKLMPIVCNSKNPRQSVYLMCSEHINKKLQQLKATLDQPQITWKFQLKQQYTTMIEKTIATTRSFKNSA